MEKVFIAFSQEVSKAVALFLKEHLLKMDKELALNIFDENSVFVSETNLNPGEAQAQINENLKDIRVGVPILTRFNRGSEWIMFEMGAINVAKDSVIMPFLFCRHPGDIEKPLLPFNFYSYQSGKDTEQNQENIFNFINFNKGLARTLGLEESLLPKIAKYINDNWEKYAITNNENKDNKGIRGKLNELSSKTEDPTQRDNKNVISTDNSSINIYALETKEQAVYWKHTNSLKQYTPGNLHNMFKDILDEFIPGDWLHPQQFTVEKTNAVHNVNRVSIHQTRFSTFVAFVDDDKNILLFDRKKGSYNTSVTNERYDVFGSVQFENRTIEIKIPNDDFLRAPIKSIKPIYGAAIENNIDEKTGKPETAVMFGIFAYMSKKDLELALKDNDALFIMPIEKANALHDSKFTSKAFLSIKQLAAQLNDQ